jgi:hypothetical protein
VARSCIHRPTAASAAGSDKVTGMSGKAKLQHV